jgi:hypothetical protein
MDRTPENHFEEDFSFEVRLPELSKIDVFPSHAPLPAPAILDAVNLPDSDEESVYIK